MRIVNIAFIAKKKALHHDFNLIAIVFVEISKIIWDYRMPIRDVQEREGAQTKTGYLWIGGRVEVRILDFFADFINE